MKKKNQDNQNVNEDLPAPKVGKSITKKLISFGKSKWMYFIILAMVVFSTATVVGVSLKYSNEVSSLVSIAIDPIVVSPQGETHVDGGQFLNFNKNHQSEEYTANVDIFLNYNEYFIYDCKIKNNSNETLYYSFDLKVEVCQNATISYVLNDQDEIVYVDTIKDNELAAKQTIVLKIYFKVNDPDHNASLKGQINFDINNKAGE